MPVPAQKSRIAGIPEIPATNPLQCVNIYIYTIYDHISIYDYYMYTYVILIYIYILYIHDYPYMQCVYYIAYWGPCPLPAP